MHPAQHTLASRLAGPAGLAALALGGALALATVGVPPDTPAEVGPLAVVVGLLTALPVPLAYALGALGLGRPLARLLCRGSPSTHWLQLGLGLGAMLWLSHALGSLGLLSGAGPAPRVVAWGTVALGLALLLDQVVRGTLRPEAWPVVPPLAVIAAPGLAVLLVAVANPPGHLWGSEFGGFDALSYHLQLPKEWLCGPRLEPVAHNVYSYLPSFMEAAYLHLGAMMPGPDDPLLRLLGGDAPWITACQLLHAMTGAAAALLAGRLAWTLAPAAGAGPRSARAVGVVAAAAVLCTPWTVVVSSLAYNEAGLLALAFAGCLAAVEPGPGPRARGAMCGLLVGLACGCKPTALFMAGPLVGLVMLRSADRRSWPAMVGAGAVAGLAAVGPWLVRNALHGGNPVFPFLHTVFGGAHWTAEQLERYARSHHAPPGVNAAERAARLFSAEFGLNHPQWAVFLPALALSLVGALAWRRSRGLAALVAAGMLVQCVCWATLTHMQSRFLLPLLVPGAALLGLAGGALGRWLDDRRAPPGVWALAVAVLSIVPLSGGLWSVSIFVGDRPRREGDRVGTPNELLPTGAGALTGMAAEPDYRAAPPETQRELEARAGVVQFMNLMLRSQDRPDAGVYLLGETSPLYFLGATGAARRPGASPVLYHTTWDRPPMAGIDPAGPRPAGLHPWTAELRRRGCRYVLVHHDELARLVVVSGYFDPAVRPQDLAAWLDGPGVRSLRRWAPPGSGPRRGVELFELAGPPASGGSTP